MKRMLVKRIFCYVLAVLVFVAGLMVFLFPFASRSVSSRNAAENLDDFRFNRRVFEGDSPYNELAEDENTLEDKKDYDPHRYDELYDAMQDYNKKIYENHQAGLKDAWSYEEAAFDLTKYGIYNNIIAEIRVPSMDCDLPLYLGATRSNMAWGAVQLGQTSMPIGGINTNCVIAGHRGCSNGRYFLDIENMKLGDKVYIDNLWGTLTYKVTEIDIIDPDEISKVLIQDGKDMVTLITCHPYPYNYKRYVVYCERTENDSQVTNTDSTDVSEQKGENQSINTQDENSVKIEDSSQMFINFEKTLTFVIPVFLFLLAVVLFVLTSKRFRRRKNK